ncbi:hypothetical protein ACFQL8_37400 [Streptomyces goshikiensis]|uniref:hypothetical protein n=1 Tax=Streptomyces goshikiensis TaxID=1942 RepID=UPI00332C6BEA
MDMLAPTGRSGSSLPAELQGTGVDGKTSWRMTPQGFLICHDKGQDQREYYLHASVEGMPSDIDARKWKLVPASRS